MDTQLDDCVDDDEEHRALEAEFKRLYAEQERLKASDDLGAWKRHLAPLVAYQARVERRRRAVGLERFSGPT